MLRILQERNTTLSFLRSKKKKKTVKEGIDVMSKFYKPSENNGQRE